MPPSTKGYSSPVVPLTRNSAGRGVKSDEGGSSGGEGRPVASQRSQKRDEPCVLFARVLTSQLNACHQVDGIGKRLRRPIVEVGIGQLDVAERWHLEQKAFDLQTREVSGSPVAVVAGVRRTAPAAGGEAHFALSASGTLAYIPGPARMGQESIFVYGDDGKTQSLNLPKGTYSRPRVSPNGQWLAFENYDGKESWIDVYDLSGRTAAQRLTFGGHSRFPVWTAAGKRIVFQSDREGDPALYWLRSTSFRTGRKS